MTILQCNCSHLLYGSKNNLIISKVGVGVKKEREKRERGEGKEVKGREKDGGKKGKINRIWDMRKSAG